MEYIILILLGSIIVSITLSWISIQIAPKIGLMDIPGSAKHKKHRKPIPLTGGLILIDTLFIMLFILGYLREDKVFVVCSSALLIALMGLVDDFIILKPKIKFGIQLLASVLLIVQGVQVNIFTSPEFFLRTNTFVDNYFNFLLTILWVTTLTNAFNFIDSSDGLAVGLSGLCSAFFIFILLNTNQKEILVLCTIILGICIGLYFFNSYPAKLFLGDSGAQTFGFILATIAILYDPKIGSQSSTWFVPVMIFFVPLFDLILVVFSRIRRKKEIYRASQDHTYHRLSMRGLSIHHSVLIMHGASLVMSMIGYLCLNLNMFFSNFIFLSSLLLAISLIIILDKDFS